VLKAASSRLRLNILTLLLDRGPLSYTEIMRILRLNPSRDAGRFAYHLKYLLKERLIEPDVEKKRYCLTDLGRLIISMTEEIEEQFFTRRKMVVRTSRLAMEEFDRNKIAGALITEAAVPVDLAQKIAREAESRLSEFKTKYLTAPLIREFVNAILIEKGLEEYRHKLTRLGLPVYDVTQLIKSMGFMSLGVEAVHKAAGDAVIEEYTLLNVLPRSIADAHLSGTLHINNLGSWILKPTEFMHDLRFFFRHGLDLGRTGLRGASYPPPKNIESALLTAHNILQIGATEICGEQAFDYFNIFLAPFAQGLAEERIGDALRTFLFNLNRTSMNRGFPGGASIGLELILPDFLNEEAAIGSGGEMKGCYADFADEAKLITSLIMEIMSEEDTHGPLFSPSLIVKVRPEALKSKECDALLFTAHKLAAEKGLPYFANLCVQEGVQTSYMATGCRLATDWKKDWELDTLRTGSLDRVTINLPRASFKAEHDNTRFYEFLEAQLGMALQALEIKYQIIQKRSREDLLPFLMQKADGDHYFRLQNASRIVSFVGLNEATQSHFGKPLYEDRKALDFAEEIVSSLFRNIQSRSKKPEIRALLSMSSNVDAARRLAKLDVENYGWAKVHAQGSRELPFYTDLVAVPLTSEIPWEDRLDVEGKFHRMTLGGHLSIVQLGNSEMDANSLLSATQKITRTYSTGLYTYNRHLSYCAGCRRTFWGVLTKCPSCGSVDRLSSISRISAKPVPSSFWDSAARAALLERVSYQVA